MEFIEPLAGLGALGICAIVLLFVAQGMKNRATEQGALIAVMSRQLDQYGAVVTQVQAMVESTNELKKDERTREQRAHEREERANEWREKVVAVLDKMLGNDDTIIKLATNSATNMVQLVEKIDEVKQTMTEHNQENEALGQLVTSINELRQDVNQIKVDIRQVKANTTAIEANIQRIDGKLETVEQQAENVKKTVTQEAVVVKVTPDPEPKAEKQDNPMPGGSVPATRSLTEKKE